MKKWSVGMFFIVVFLIPVSIYAVVNWYEDKKGALPILGKSQLKDGKEVEHTISDFSLVNQKGEAVSLAKWKNKIVVADFFFTHCASICPKMTANLKKLQAALPNDKQLQISSFTVDPERDSAGRLQQYSQQFSLNTTNWDLLTGDKKELYKLARKSFLVVATDGDGGANDFIHSDKLVLIDKQQRIRGYYDGTEETDINQLINDIKKLKDEN